MATVQGPLHSDEASGTIADQLTYRRTKRGPVVVAASAPGSANPFTPSADQLAVRARTKTIMETWPTLTVEEKLTWFPMAELADVAPINAFMRINYARLTEGLVLIRTPNPPPPPTPYRLVTHDGDPPLPDPTGTYERTADYNGHAAYVRTGLPTYTLFFSTLTGAWLLAPEPEPADDTYFYLDAADPEGTYQAALDAEGSPIVGPELTA